MSTPETRMKDTPGGFDVRRGLDPLRRDHADARRDPERDLGDRRDRRLELLRPRHQYILSNLNTWGWVT